jgi:succinyl-CoA synthetase alpha subunit
MLVVAPTAVQLIGPNSQGIVIPPATGITPLTVKAVPARHWANPQ